MSKLIGTAPNQVPSNADLGTMAYQDYDAVAPQLIGGRRNIIINGDMRIAQRATSVSGVSTNGYKTCDRFWSYTATNVDFSQSTDAPDGFSHSYRVDGNSSSASATNNYAMIRQLIEAQNLTGLAYGTSSAKSFTFSFWVKTSRTGTYTLVFLNHAATQRQISATYTVNSAGTWEYKTVTIGGDTSSAFTTTGNSTGLTMDFMLNPYTGYTSGTFNDSAWVNNVAADRVHPDQVDVIQGDSDYFAITGVQLEVGSVATPFEYRSYGEELALCQRYYQKLYYRSYNIFRTDISATQIAVITLVNPIRTAGTVGWSGSTGLNISIDSMVTTYDTSLVMTVTSSGAHNNWINQTITIDAEL